MRIKISRFSPLSLSFRRAPRDIRLKLVSEVLSDLVGRVAVDVQHRFVPHQPVTIVQMDGRLAYAELQHLKQRETEEIILRDTNRERSCGRVMSATFRLIMNTREEGSSRDTVAVIQFYRPSHSLVSFTYAEKIFIAKIIIIIIRSRR